MGKDSLVEKEKKKRTMQNTWLGNQLDCHQNFIVMKITRNDSGIEGDKKIGINSKQKIYFVNIYLLDVSVAIKSIYI